MNDNNNQRQGALRLLGIESNSHLELIKQAVASKNLSGSALAGIVPNALVLLSRVFEAEEPAQQSALKKLNLSPKLLEQAKKIAMEEITPISQHPQFSSAISTIFSRNASQPQGELSKEESNAPYTEIEQVSSFPMLIGQKPPYLPLLKLIVTAENKKTILGETIQWADLLFLGHACLNQVLGHAKHSADQIRNGLITGIPEDKLDKVLNDIRSTVSELEAHLKQAASENVDSQSEKK